VLHVPAMVVSVILLRAEATALDADGAHPQVGGRSGCFAGVTLESETVPLRPRPRMAARDIPAAEVKEKLD
jgi:hypothetical protein